MRRKREVSSLSREPEEASITTGKEEDAPPRTAQIAVFRPTTTTNHMWTPARPLDDVLAARAATVAFFEGEGEEGGVGVFARFVV
jgi:hypothetical protein